MDYMTDTEGISCTFLMSLIDLYAQYVYFKRQN